MIKMIKSTYRLEITKTRAWEIDAEVGERFKWAEHALMKHYGDNTLVVCTLESVENIPIPAAYSQVRRSTSTAFVYTCIGTHKDFVWVTFEVSGKEYHTTYAKAVFESWPLEES